MFAGEIYLDGSALDGPNPELMRCGWAFVVICFETGEVTASALGAPPPWITDIGDGSVGNATGSTHGLAGKEVQIQR